MSQKQSVFLYSEAFEKYPYPADCPFKTERATQARKTLKSMGLLSGPYLKEIAPQPADRTLLEIIHSADYLNKLQESEKGKWDLEALQMGIGGPDNPVFKGMYGYGALVAGASVKGAELLLSKEATIAFNPSGGHHHAMHELAAGFCYINDVAIACKYLAQRNKRVLFLDIDVHHGDGVQSAFYSSNEVMTISLHESGHSLFPGTGFEDEIGTGKGKGYSVNIPLPAGTYNTAYMHCFYEIVDPLIEAFIPDIMVVEIGADTLAGDPLAHLKLTNLTITKIINHIIQLNVPVLFTGGGGYHIENTARAWALAWIVMTGQDKDINAMNIGMGGVMLESTDWMGGLQDREIPVTEEQKKAVDPVIEKTIETLKQTVFPIHKIS